MHFGGDSTFWSSFAGDAVDQAVLFVGDVAPFLMVIAGLGLMLVFVAGIVRIAGVR